MRTRSTPKGSKPILGVGGRKGKLSVRDVFPTSHAAQTDTRPSPRTVLTNRSRKRRVPPSTSQPSRPIRTASATRTPSLAARVIASAACRNHSPTPCGVPEAYAVSAPR